MSNEDFDLQNFGSRAVFWETGNLIGGLFASDPYDGADRAIVDIAKTRVMGWKKPFTLCVKLVPATRIGVCRDG